MSSKVSCMRRSFSYLCRRQGEDLRAIMYFVLSRFQDVGVRVDTQAFNLGELFPRFSWTHQRGSQEMFVLKPRSRYRCPVCKMNEIVPSV